MQPTIPQMSSPAGGKPSMRRSSYDERGLVPCVVQDWRSGEVLTLAYMNEQALQRTRETGRAAPVEPLARGAVAQGRNERQHPGGAGAARWTATATRCSRWSSRRVRPATRASAPAFTAASSSRPRRTRLLPALERTLRARARERPAGSYTVELLDDPPRIGEKVMEEAEEVARAAREESDERVDEEAADVLYHLLVLLRSRGRSLADAERVLDGRRSLALRRSSRARRAARSRPTLEQARALAARTT